MCSLSRPPAAPAASSRPLARSDLPYEDLVRGPPGKGAILRSGAQRLTRTPDGIRDPGTPSLYNSQYPPVVSCQAPVRYTNGGFATRAWLRQRGGSRAACQTGGMSPIARLEANGSGEWHK